MSRYPYTEAADFVRSRVVDYLPGASLRMPTISRAEASAAYGAIAEALGMEKEELAKKLADYARAQKPRHDP